MALSNLYHMLALFLIQTNSGLFFYEADSPGSLQAIEQVKVFMPEYCFENLKSVDSDYGREGLGHLSRINIIDTTGSLDLSERIKMLFVSNGTDIHVTKVLDDCSKLDMARKSNNTTLFEKQPSAHMRYLCHSGENSIKYLGSMIDDLQLIQFDDEAKSTCNKTGFRLEGSDLNVFTNDIRNSMPDTFCRKACGSNKRASFGNSSIGRFASYCNHCNWCEDCIPPQTTNNECPHGCLTPRPEGIQGLLEGISTTFQIEFGLSAVVFVILLAIHMTEKLSNKKLAEDFWSGQSTVSALMFTLSLAYWPLVFCLTKFYDISLMSKGFLYLGAFVVDHLFWSWSLIVPLSQSLSTWTQIRYLAAETTLASIVHALEIFAGARDPSSSVCYTVLASCIMYLLLLIFGYCIVHFHEPDEFARYQMASKVGGIFVYVLFEAYGRSLENAQKYMTISSVDTKVVAYLWDVLMPFREIFMRLTRTDGIYRRVQDFLQSGGLLRLISCGLIGKRPASPSEAPISTAATVQKVAPTAAVRPPSATEPFV